MSASDGSGAARLALFVAGAVGIAATGFLVITVVGSVSPRPVPDGVSVARATITGKTERTEQLPSSTRLLRCVGLKVHLQPDEAEGEACRYVWGDRWDALAVGDEVEVIYVESELEGTRLKRVGLRD